MLKMKVTKLLHWSSKPWESIGLVPPGSIVDFVKTESPANVPNEICNKHLNVADCRNIVVSCQGQEFTTNVCMEEASHYFILVEHDHGKIS